MVTKVTVALRDPPKKQLQRTPMPAAELIACVGKGPSVTYGRLERLEESVVVSLL